MRECDEIAKKLKEVEINPTRASILTYLSIVGEAKLKDLSSALGLSKSVTWKHVKEMKSKGLLAVRYTLGSHPEMIVSITPEGLKKLMEYLQLHEKVKECVQRKTFEKDS
ncbi:hypothetical protein EYM_04430 [Ignicoccus islandicus DSM 13165]|uniref:Winged helix DNA-binding domain-containing protein n=1 Tax=Ignicoccus islandicus DSM 13165 TaxID=940295 RepID=A0A0U3G2G6_9CREN|nr:transcriptional regulator [Ignicoccus islandicus]ALU12492.1 hypothetical protein EYM_04430 [Ignicoccus islandicus DSM 13165]